MANNYFQFKQFTVHQENCAMKVCTDACLFGACVADTLKTKHLVPGYILDIGAGTGLLSLMLAQQISANIDAVEIDAGAALQSKQNFEASPWKERLNIHHTPVQQFYETSGKLYDFIIVNPPFFDNDLKSSNDQRNLALHNTALDLEILLSAIDRLLTAKGSCAILLPFHRNDYFKELVAQNRFHLQEEILVKQSDKHTYFRTMLWFSRLPANVITKREISITDIQGEYTESFITLLKDYYLYL